MTLLDPDVGERMTFTVIALAPDERGGVKAVLFHVIGGSAQHAVIRVTECMRGLIPISCFIGQLNDEMAKTVVRI